MQEIFGRGRRRTLLFFGAVLSSSCGLTAVGSFDPRDVGAADAGVVEASPTGDEVVVDGSDATRECFALRFDGNDDHVTVNDSADLDPVGPSTIEAWVQLTKDTSNELHVVSHHDHGDRLGYLLMAFGYARNGDTAAQLGGCTRYYDGTDTNQVGFGNGSSMALYRWVHLAATYDGTTIRIHVDGKERGSKTSLPRHPNADLDGVLSIGRNALEDNFAWGGLIDEVRISKVARYSASDFTPAARFADDADTVALWHFDEGMGTVVSDVAGTHPGTISGAQWVRTPSCDAR